MKIFRNEKLIKRNGRIGQIAMLSSLLILAGGMFLSFQYPEQVSIYLGALLLGFILSQIGIFFSNRWGRRPRPDEVLDKGLKGLDDKYALYHWSSPASHLLVGPAGVWVLIPYYQRGQISYRRDRWRQKGGNFFMKIFGQENLGRPDLEISGEEARVKRFLEESLSEDSIPIQGALVFTHPDVEINISEDEEPPAETVHVNKLKDLIRKQAKSNSLSMEKVDKIQDLFGKEN